LASIENAPADPTGPRFRIEDIYPSVDGGRFAVKRIVGDPISVWADVVRDGHDEIRAALRWRRADAAGWDVVAMRLHGNDRWTADFVIEKPGRHVFQIEAWTDQFATWRRAFLLKQDAGQDVSVDALEGRALLTTIVPADRTARSTIDRALASFDDNRDAAALTAPEVAEAVAASGTRPDLSRSVLIPLVVDRPRARFGSWYEMVPRSQSRTPGQHGTFQDCIARIPEIAALGFDVLYFTPIHPIGRTNRKGRNNSLHAGPDDPGSFYAIGNEHGGHDAVHPQLGTLDDFRAVVATCKAHNMEVALDVAVQCSPDHPWLQQHPQWFQRRPDGTIKFAENPPKKYEDIVNPDFSSEDRIALWQSLRDVLLFWVDQGVEIFRIDNPHTKPLPFWEWLIREVQQRNSNVLFLSEAFTRPKLMKALAKLGFSQSYTYFTWRTTKHELQEYLAELTGYPEREYFRPNFFVTTPDILPVQLQTGETWLFKSRAALAAILSSNYGIYNGFELIEHEPLPGREEYLNSEKYEIRTRDWDKPGNIKPYLAMLNRLRRENAALQQTSNLRFLTVDDDGIIGFIKEAVDGSNAVAGALAVTGHAREFWLHFGDTLALGQPVRAIENLVTGEQRRLEWGGTRLWINPGEEPALLFRCLT
jgi:starch synthase (maltosyl-transferring)